MRVTPFNSLVLGLLGLLTMACTPVRDYKIVAALPLDAQEGSGLAWGMVRTLQLAFNDLKPQGGPYRVTFEVVNTAGPDGMPVADLEVQAARKAAADPQVMAYFGSMFSKSCQLTIPILNQAGIAQLSTTATYAGLTKPGFGPGEPGIYYPTGTSTFFRLFNSDDTLGQAGALWARDLGFKKVFFVYEENDFNSNLRQTFWQSASETGLTRGGEAMVPQKFEAAEYTAPHLDKSFFDALARTIARSGSDLVYFSGYRASGFLITEALHKDAPTVRIMGSELYDIDLVKTLGPGAEGVLSPFPGELPGELPPQAAAMAARYKKTYGQDLGDTAWRSMLGYDGMAMVLNALKNVPNPTPQALVEYLHRTTFQGLMNVWNFDETGDITRPFITGLVVEHGAWKSVGALRVR